MPGKGTTMPFPLDETELKKTEEEIGAVLPKSYRNAMMKCNGGSVEAWDELRGQSCCVICVGL